MDYKDIRTLKLLEEIEKDYAPSQRDLSRKLNISLGLVNSFLKRLAQKGYLKITNIPKNRIKYILTPQGMAEKTRLTYNYIQYSYRFYRDARQKLRELFQDFMAQGVHRVVFYGAGDLAEIAYVSLQETYIQLVVVVDDLKIGEKFFERLVSAPAELESLSFDRILITADGLIEDVMERLLEKGIPRNKIVVLE